jgi:hypothetical protein
MITQNKGTWLYSSPGFLEIPLCVEYYQLPMQFMHTKIEIAGLIRGFCGSCYFIGYSNETLLIRV